MKILRHPFFLLAVILCLAFVLRVINLKDNILFAYDQARDAQRIYTMVYNGHFKIVGPETDIQGIFNGPLLYYVLAPVYFFSHFNPNVAALFFVVVNVATILLVYWAAKIVFRKESAALIASLLWAVSYEQGFFSRYISNASPMAATSALFFIGLFLFFIQKKEWGLPLSAVGIGLAIHCNFYFIYLFAFYPLMFIWLRRKPQIKTTIETAGVSLFLLSPWIITEIKWKFVGAKSLIAYFTDQKTGLITIHLWTIIGSVLTHYYERMSQAVFNSFIPNKVLGVFIALIIALYLMIRKRSSATVFLMLWLFSTLPLFVFKSGALGIEVINESIFIPLTLLFSFGIVELGQIKIKRFPLVSFLCLAGIVFYCLSQYVQNNFIPMSIQTNVPTLLKDEKKIIDYTYAKAQKKDFAICAISEPLFMNTVWSFLYATYGKSNYGYLPYWTGQRQIMNDSFIPYAHKKFATKFIIQEPMQGIPSFAPRATYYIEAKQNIIIERKKFGNHIVEERYYTKDNGGNTDAYPSHLKDSIEEDISIVPQFSCNNTYE